MKPLFWEVKTRFSATGDSEVVRRTRSAGHLRGGSSPDSEIKLPQPAALEAFRISRVVDDKSGKAQYLVEILDEKTEIEIKGKWTHRKDHQEDEVPRLRCADTIIEVVELKDERRLLTFEPERWASEAHELIPGQHALWWLRDGLLVESAILENTHTVVFLKIGYGVQWTSPERNALKLIEQGGVPRTIELVPGRQGAIRGTFENNILIVTGVPKKSLYETLETQPPPAEKDWFRTICVGVGATWLLLVSLLQMMPPQPHEDVPLEQLSQDVAKIILEAPKEKNTGGDGQVGGGGNEQATANDKRGGSGFESKQMASAGPDEVIVKDKGALGALNKAEKALGSGVLKALEAGGALASALNALDDSVKSGKVKTASLGGRGNGKGSAGGVLGALGALGGGGKGGGGLGMGGVGTKGLGGGGGGGQGAGFGTGIGNGLGKGDGARTVLFDSENIAVRGGLERSEVDAVIQENLSQIRFCYNQGLRSNPHLAGKVTSSFVIGPTGQVKVSRVNGSTLAAPEVENCIKGRVATWTFPQPRGGGEVQVNYPFLLRAN